MLFAAGTHVITEDLNFKFDNTHPTSLVDTNSNYISHGDIHIIRVPNGSVAKAWIGSKAILLDSKEEPYIFKDEFFKLESVGRDDYFLNASDSAIRHGAIKRLTPRTGEVAVTYNSGCLEIYEKPVTIDSATHAFDCFLDTTLKSLSLPTLETQRTKERENRRLTTDEIHFDILTTKDSLRLALKLAVFL